MFIFYFFTDIQTNISQYNLLNIKYYNKIDNFHKKIYFIDPSVLELKNNWEYSHIKELHKIASNRPKLNEFISIDYPPDMNLELSQLFIKKSILNNIKYKKNSHYICTIQYNFKDFSSFVYNYEYLNDKIDFSQKIIGFGNLCRILRLKGKNNQDNYKYYKQIKEYLIPKLKNLKWIHFYGLSYQAIGFLINELQKANKQCIISIDSTKWTKAIDITLKWKLGFQCNKQNRDIYFLYYINKIKSKFKVPVIY